ncbi:sugar phosphorylase [Thalassoglobus sp. JC818]|uniref:sugar phosphorylase n=1 Tax=Thalassoglobus sp. JC818 TaxID=3232136 RepID=UPI0034596BAE
MNEPESSPYLHRLRNHCDLLYPDIAPEDVAHRIEEVLQGVKKPRSSGNDLWSSRDAILITYGDSIQRLEESPLQTLHQFLKATVDSDINSVHILPFCPFSSDDGFAVIDYREINPKLGDWNDVEQVSSDYRLMADLVINHVSSESEWFENYQSGRTPGAGFFVEANPDEDLTSVVRPRASSLLREVQTPQGTRYVWCTFSHDQVDLNFRNFEVFIEFLKIIRIYLDHGVEILRLDAIGYLWKKIGTTCIHLPETHEMVRFLRTVLDEYAPGSILITETNVPNQENLTYFGNGNEAHIIYNFSLAPLMLHALLAGTSKYLKAWMMSMPPAPMGCTYLNFTASHDGIGMRPAEGLLSDQEQEEMVRTIEKFGGKLSTRKLGDGTEKVYELNVSLFDALQGTLEGLDRYQVERFICSQTIMMALEGIPAFYIHSLVATPNDTELVEKTGRARSINRHQWDADELEKLLDDPQSPQSRVSSEILRRMRIRSQQPAFDPSAVQFTLHLKTHFFGFWRQSRDRRQSIFAINNVTSRRRSLTLSDLNLIVTDNWFDLLTGERFDDRSQKIALAPYQTLWITNWKSD